MYNSSYTLKKITDLYKGGFELEAMSFANISPSKCELIQSWAANI